MSNGADSAAKHKLPPVSESTPHFEVMECGLRALTTMDPQLCHRISVTLVTKPDLCLCLTCSSIFFIVEDVAFLFQAQLNYFVQRQEVESKSHFLPMKRNSAVFQTTEILRSVLQ